MRAHEVIAAEVLEHVSVGFDAVANSLRDDPEKQTAFKGVAMLLRACAQAMAYRGKDYTQLVNDIRRPRAALVDDDTRSERPVAKRREREDP